MEFIDFLISTISSAVVSTALTSLLFFLLKSSISERLKNAIKSEYDEKLESHKAQLQMELEMLKVKLKSDSDVEQERLRSQLQIIAAQENTMFTRLHERRMEAIEVVYSNILSAHGAVGRYIDKFQMVGAPSDEENLKKVQEAYGIFKTMFVEKQLFLPRRIAAAIGQLDDIFLSITNQFTLIVKADPKRPNTEVWMKLIERFQTEVTKVIEELNEDMRVALGDRNSEQHK